MACLGGLVEGAKQQNLVITSPFEPEINVNIEWRSSFISSLGLADSAGEFHMASESSGIAGKVLSTFS
jgi:hypothetical protein